MRSGNDLTRASMLFRTQGLNTPVGDRFGPSPEGFVVRREGEVQVAEIACSPERAVALFTSLIAELPAEVDIALWCARSGARYQGDTRLRSEVVEALATLLSLLPRSGGVEITLYSSADQIALSTGVEVWVYSQTERWPFVLASWGLEECAELPRRAWDVRPGDFRGAPDVVQAVREVADRLTLTSERPQ